MNIDNRVSVASTLLCMSAAMLLWSGPIYAAGPNWSYIEAGYAKLDISGPTGFFVGGSHAMHENAFAFAGFARFEHETHVYVESSNVGVGYNRETSDKVDVFATLFYVSGEAAGGAISAQVDGFGTSFGMRLIDDSSDFRVAAQYVDLGGGNSGELSVSIAAYVINERFGVGVDANIYDGGGSYGVGFRLYL